MRSYLRQALVLAAALAVTLPAAMAQSVCLPAPRLLTTMPMGGQVGTEVAVTISGQHIEDVSLLRFSTTAALAHRLGALPVPPKSQ